MDDKRLILITLTRDRAERMLYIERMGKIIKDLDNCLWFIMEESHEKDSELEEYVKSVTENYIYDICYGIRHHYHDQINEAFKRIQKEKYNGIIFLMEDHVFVEKQMFDELRKTNGVSAFPVGDNATCRFDRPIYINGKIMGWEASWKPERYFPSHRSGFAFESKLLFGLDRPVWNFRGVNRGGESEFLQRIVEDLNDIQLLCDNCTKCYIWDNEPLWES